MMSQLRAAFTTGRYFSPSAILSGKGAIDVGGPGVIEGGATVFSLAAAPGADRHLSEHRRMVRWARVQQSAGHPP